MSEKKHLNELLKVVRFEQSMNLNQLAVKLGTNSMTLWTWRRKNCMPVHYRKKLMELSNGQVSREDFEN